MNLFDKNEIMFIHNSIENLTSAMIGELEDNNLIDHMTLNVNKKENANYDLNYRSNKLSWITSNEESKWIYTKIKESVLDVNKKYMFDLTDLEILQYTSYDKDEFYKKHIDTGSTLFVGDTCRKLSFSVQLTPPEEYDGGELLIYHSEEPLVAPKNLGSITYFPSFLLHEVKPVTRGKRVSLVGWVYGPTFR